MGAEVTVATVCIPGSDRARYVLWQPDTGDHLAIDPVSGAPTLAQPLCGLRPALFRLGSAHQLARSLNAFQRPGLPQSRWVVREAPGSGAD